MKILINTPSLKILGGVANHYLGLEGFWTETVKYNTVGKRTNAKRSGIFWLPFDILKFLYRLFVFRPNIVLLNPSLGNSALKRDFLFLRLAAFLGIKVAVFIHGFDWEYAKNINSQWIAKNLNKASKIFVLGSAFKKRILSWGVKIPIVLTTTKVDDNLLKDYDPVAKRSGKVKVILFLARVERAKGIYITVDTFAILKKEYPFLSLKIVGDGEELPRVKQYVEKLQLNDVVFTGRLSGKDISEAYESSDLYSSSSSYGEGMPTAVLEAMAFGLPVFTRNVGGLPDFFEDQKMGFITDPLDAKVFAEAMIPYIENQEKTKKVSDYNAHYAKKHFMASQVARNMEIELLKTIRS